MEYLSPAVYIDEIPTRMRSIEGVKTSTAAFVGVTELGPGDRVLLVKSFAEFQKQYGGFVTDGWVAHAALQFFANGGKDLYIARVTSAGDRPVEESDYKRAFGLLEQARGLSIVAVPGVGTPEMVGFAAAFCQRRQNCVFVGDLAQTDQTREQVLTFVNRLTSRSSYAALYLPWIKIADPTGLSREPVIVPPSGSVAGIFARVDQSRGVWKAPAGEQATIAGAIGVSTDVSEADQDEFNAAGVNTIRSFASQGTVVWGARTVGGVEDSDYPYVPARRTAIFLGRSIQKGTRWAVFDENDEALWSDLKRTVSDFLLPLWRAGAFQGNKPEEAFFVKVDRETTTQADLDNGVVNIVIGFAPLQPAEFVIIKIGQWAKATGTQQSTQVSRRGCGQQIVLLPFILPAQLLLRCLGQLHR